MIVWGFDLDEVVCDCSNTLLDIVNGYFGTEFVLNDLTDYYFYNILGITAQEFQPVIDIVWRPDCLLSLPVILGGRTLVNKIKHMGCAVYFITARDKKLRSVTQTWLDKNGVEYDNVFFTDSGKKSPIAKELGVKYFVEDNLKHAIDVASLGVTVFVPEYPWNKNKTLERNIIPVKECSMILDMIDETGNIK